MRRFPHPLASLALLAACAGESASPAGAAGGTLVIATPGDADALLPPVAATQVAAHVTERLFPKLAELGLELNTADETGFVPILAERWERRDSLTLAFHLDPRARWQDGAPLTADDVVFTFDVYRDDLTASPYRPLLEPIESVTREGERTAVFRFRRAYPEQLYDATYHLRILPKHLLDSIPRQRLAASAFARAPVGMGPFRFARWAHGEQIVVEADTAYFLGRPKLDRLVWRVLPDVTAAVSALIAGEADAMEVVPQLDEIERVRRAPGLRLVAYPSPFIAGVLFNLRRPPFEERELRRALAMAVDRETIVRNLFGPYGEVPVGSTSPVQWIAQGAVGQLPYDTLAAQRLLDSLGWLRPSSDQVRRRAGRPLRFTLQVPTTSRLRQQAAVLLQDQLARLGVEVRILPLEFSVFDRRTRLGEFDAMFFSWTLDPSPAILAQFWRAGGPDNRGGYASAAFDSLYAAAAATRDREAGLRAWHHVLELLNHDAPAIFIYAPRNQAALARRVENVTIRPDSWLATVAAWSLAAERGARP